MKTKSFLMIASLAMLSLFSCKKDSVVIEQSSIDLADDDAVADVIYEDVFNTADNATIILDGLTKGIEAKSEMIISDSCPAITVTHATDGVWPKEVTVDYGTACIGLNNNVRSGKILIEVTGPRLQTGSRRTVTFADYYFNGIKVEGTKVLENKGFNSSQDLVVSVILTGGKLTLPDGKVIERSVEHQRVWIAGLNTKNIWDDECLITGTATGKNIDGISYKNTILTALDWKRACLFIVSGVVKIERDEAQPVEIDYGTGDCDAKAVVTRNGLSKEILLRNKHRNMWKN
jgi:hypothetical protein